MVRYFQIVVDDFTYIQIFPQQSCAGKMDNRLKHPRKVCPARGDTDYKIFNNLIVSNGFTVLFQYHFLIMQNAPDSSAKPYIAIHL